MIFTAINEAEYRAALERTIEESDGLIRTFNALLMIARAESGQARGNMDDFDAADSSFADLCSAPDATTRDAARLARAQLWIAHGRGDAVRPVLRDLAAHGATALVRQRAAEFLSVTNR